LPEKSELLRMNAKLEIAMAKAGLRPADLERLCCVKRNAVYRWRNGRTRIPGYVWTILRQQAQIVALSQEIAKSS
jgi:hypothetical protein